MLALVVSEPVKQSRSVLGVALHFAKAHSVHSFFVTHAVLGVTKSAGALYRF